MTQDTVDSLENELTRGEVLEKLATLEDITSWLQGDIDADDEAAVVESYVDMNNAFIVACEAVGDYIAGRREWTVPAREEEEDTVEQPV